MPRIAKLPTALITRYQTVDREEVGAPPEVADTPQHLDRLETDVAAHGIQVPLDLKFNVEFATLDGHNRLAVARRLGLEGVPVALSELPLRPRPWWAQDVRAEDYAQLQRALAEEQ
jgi:ParB-like chromosome segregation protein Spo0J